MLAYKKTLVLLFLGINCITSAMHKNGLSKTNSFKENPAMRPDIKEACDKYLQEKILLLNKGRKVENVSLKELLEKEMGEYFNNTQAKL